MHVELYNICIYLCIYVCKRIHRWDSEDENLSPPVPGRTCHVGPGGVGTGSHGIGAAKSFNGLV